jgi:hypothetical protein
VPAKQIAEKLGFRRTAPKGASQFKELTASLKRCPDTKLEFFSNLFSRRGDTAARKVLFPQPVQPRRKSRKIGLAGGMRMYTGSDFFRARKAVPFPKRFMRRIGDRFAGFRQKAASKAGFTSRLTSIHSGPFGPGKIAPEKQRPGD